MARPKVSQQIDLEAAIRKTAWEQIATLGASSLTLRGIARQLGITAPAIYNYFPSRDELVTALIIEAYAAFGDSQLDAIAGLPVDDYAGRLRATGLAYREWAMTYPQRYQLIFGTPIPGYHAPLEEVMPVAARSLTALIGALEGAYNAGLLKEAGNPELPAALREWLEKWTPIHPVSNVYVLYLTLVIWSRVHGMMMLEIGNQCPPFIEDPGEIYRREIEMIAQDYLVQEYSPEEK